MGKRGTKSRAEKPKDELPHALNVAHKKSAFLRALRKLGGKHLAAEAIGMSHQQVWRWEKDDMEFRMAILAVQEMDTQELEAVARSRAVEKSDLLAMFLLKGRRPEMYRDNVRVSGDAEAPLTLKIVKYGEKA